MAAKAGEKAGESGRFHCVHCSESVEVKKGEEIPPCPNGHKTFERRSHERGGRARADRSVGRSSRRASRVQGRLSARLPPFTTSDGKSLLGQMRAREVVCKVRRGEGNGPVSELEHLQIVTDAIDTGGTSSPTSARPVRV